MINKGNVPVRRWRRAADAHKYCPACQKCCSSAFIAAPDLRAGLSARQEEMCVPACVCVCVCTFTWHTQQHRAGTHSDPITLRICRLPGRALQASFGQCSHCRLDSSPLSACLPISWAASHCALPMCAPGSVGSTVGHACCSRIKSFSSNCSSPDKRISRMLRRSQISQRLSQSVSTLQVRCHCKVMLQPKRITERCCFQLMSGRVLQWQQRQADAAHLGKPSWFCTSRAALPRELNELHDCQWQLIDCSCRKSANMMGKHQLNNQK